MARPPKQGLDYFPHDTDAGWGADDKTDTLIMLHGIEGYGVYFLLLERIYRTHDLEYEFAVTEIGMENRQTFKKRFRISEKKLQIILDFCVKRKLFDQGVYKVRGILTSDSIKRRAATVLDRRAKAKNEYDKLKVVSASETTQETTQETTSETPESKRKEKENKRKTDKNIYVDFVDWFNAEFKTRHKPATFREKILARLDTYSVTQLKEAAMAMKRDPYMMGENDRHRVFGTLEYITRNNINVDKWLNMKEPQDAKAAKIAAKTDKYRDIYAM